VRLSLLSVFEISIKHYTLYNKKFLSIGNSMVSSQFGKNMHKRVFQRLSKLPGSEGGVQFEVFSEKLTMQYMFFSNCTRNHIIAY
jgi:hypothetical protein